MPRRDLSQIQGLKTQGLGIRAHMTQRRMGADWFRSARFHEEVVNEHGEIAVHEIALPCPKCQDTDIDKAVIGNSYCPLCLGDGFIYREPHLVQGLMTGVKYGQSLDDMGWASPGDCTFSLAPNVVPQISTFDKITFTHPENVGYGQVMKRGLWHQRNSAKFAANEDRLDYIVAEVMFAEDEDGVTYKQDIDFVTDQKVLKWIGQMPVIGKKVAIKYTAFFEWIAFTPSSERRDNGRSLGDRVVLRKKHIVWLGDDVKKPPALERVKVAFGDAVVV